MKYTQFADNFQQIAPSISPDCVWVLDRLKVGLEVPTLRGRFPSELSRTGMRTVGNFI